MIKNETYFLRVPLATALLAERIKNECGYAGRDDLLKHVLETLVAIKTGAGLPAFIEDVKRRRLEILAEREKRNAEARQVGRSGEGAEIRRGADGDT